MELSDFLSIGAVVGAVNAVLGFWAKSRIESSIKHEYDRQLEQLRAELKRADVLLSERLAAFKVLQKKLVSLKRYCEANANAEAGGEFGRRPCDLSVADNKSVLMHWHEIEALLDENLIVLSGPCRTAFQKLQSHLSLGSSMELAVHAESGEVASRSGCYEAISVAINECINALYLDLGLPQT